MKAYCTLIGFLLLSATVAGQTIAEWLEQTSQNPAVLAAGYESAAAHAASEGAGYLPDPMVNLGVGVMPSIMDGGLMVMPRLNVMQTLPWPGTLPLMKQVVATQADIISLGSQQMLVNVQQQMREALYGWWWQQERQQRLGEKKEWLVQMETWQQQQLSVGNGSTREILSLQRMQLEADNALQEATLAQQSLSASINRLAGRPINDTVVVDDTLTFPEKLPSLQSGELLQVAPAKQQEVLAADRAQLALLNGKPMLGVGLEYMFLTNRMEGFPAIAGRHVVLPMLSVSLPVYRKRVNASILEQEQMALAAQQYSADKALEVESYRWQQQRQWEQAQLNYRTAVAQQALLEQELQLLEKAFETDLASQGQWIQLQLDMTDLQLMQAEAIYRAHMAHSALQWINTTVQP